MCAECLSFSCLVRCVLPDVMFESDNCVCKTVFHNLSLTCVDCASQCAGRRCCVHSRFCADSLCRPSRSHQYLACVSVSDVDVKPFCLVAVNSLLILTSAACERAIWICQVVLVAAGSVLLLGLTLTRTSHSHSHLHCHCHSCPPRLGLYDADIA
jgi:hypothetical protein